MPASSQKETEFMKDMCSFPMTKKQMRQLTPTRHHREDQNPLANSLNQKIADERQICTGYKDGGVRARMLREPLLTLD